MTQGLSPEGGHAGAIMRVGFYHNSLWARYKGAVFSRVYPLSKRYGIGVSFIQIAETDRERVALGGVDLSYHEYPFRLLFHGSYEDASRLRRIGALSLDLIKHPVDLAVLSGYDRVENWAMLLVCIVLRRKRAVFCDSTMYDRPQVWWKGWAKRLFFNRCNGFFGYGQRSKEYLMSLGANEADIIIPCQAAALPHDYDASQVLAQYSRQKAGSFDLPRFLFLGRLSVEKGLIDLLNAFSLVHPKIPGAHLDVVGAGPLAAELADRVKELGLTQSVTLHGAKNLSDIIQQFLDSVALVLPSHSEPWGLVVNESLSYGCPIVASDRCGCVPELVIEGVTGYSFEPGNVPALAAAMLAVSKLSRDRVSTARKCIEVVSAFTPERAASRMLEGCKQILEGHD
jgi:glycosyltransferase involved in cell wall biosynthesis